MRRGSKYDSLRDYLTASRRADLTLSLGEIEEILGFALCESAATPQFWANIKGKTQHTQYRAWRDAGFDAFLVRSQEVVRFVRVQHDRTVSDAVRDEIDETTADEDRPSHAP